MLGEFTAKDIVLLGLDSKGNTTQESSAVMTTANATVTVDITVGAVISDNVGMTNDSYVWCSDQHE